MNLKEMASGSLESVCLACDKDQCQALVNGFELSGSIEGWKFLDLTSSFSTVVVYVINY